MPCTDWCHVEAAGAGSYEFDSFRNVSYLSLEKMCSVSPIAHIEHVVTPTLLLLGAKDRRVPYSQGLEYYHILRSRGVESKLLVFPEDNHALDRPLTEAEQWIAVMDWFLKHDENNEQA
jgi:acylaminoacyl-peptidase